MNDVTRILPPPIETDPYLTGSGDETATVRGLLARAKSEGRGLGFGKKSVTVESLDLDYSADATDATIYGFRAVPITGQGPRATVIQQAASAGADTPLIRVGGKNVGTAHEGKLTGAVISHLELRGNGKASGKGHGIETSIVHDYLIENCWIWDFGGDAIRLRREHKDADHDDWSHFFRVQGCKLFGNGGAGINAAEDDFAVGPGEIVMCEAFGNGGWGYDLIAAGIACRNANAYGNGAGGLRSRKAPSALSLAQGLTLDTCRLESNGGTDEILIDGGYDPLLLNCTVQANAGAHCLTIGNGSDTVYGAVVIGGYFSGDGSAGTAGQRAFRIGANANSTVLLNPRIEATRFVDSFAGGDPMSVVSDSGTGTQVFTSTARRLQDVFVRTSSASLILDARVFGDAARRHAVLASGEHQWGGGSTAADTNLYRSAADKLKTDDMLLAVLGLGVGNSAAATTPGSVVKKFAVYDASGTLLGYCPLYDGIA